MRAAFEFRTACHVAPPTSDCRMAERRGDVVMEEVEGRAGHGATFRVALPIAEANPARNGPAWCRDGLSVRC